MKKSPQDHFFDLWPLLYTQSLNFRGIHVFGSYLLGDQTMYSKAIEFHPGTFEISFSL